MSAANKRKDTAPRKLPSQKRSKDNVERILTAAAVVLEESGYDELKTVTIAKQAGASVGSVYQYFPNKHAILTQLVERWLAADISILDEIDNRQDQYDSIIDEFCDLAGMMVANYREQKGLMAIVALCKNIQELREKEQAHDKMYSRRLAAMIARHDLIKDPKECRALAGYISIIIDATAMSVVTDEESRATFKVQFLKQSIRDIFHSYL